MRDEVNIAAVCRGKSSFPEPYLLMGGVNHCSLHCRLAKVRGLMYKVKYGAVIGRETRIFVCAYNFSNNFQAMGFF